MGLGPGQLGRRQEVEAQEGGGEGGGAEKAAPPSLSLSPHPEAKEGRSPGARTPIFRLTPPPPEAASQLPLFGYTVYVVLRASDLTLPRPSLLGLNRQHLILMDPSSQVGWAPAPGRAWAPGHSPPTTHTVPRERVQPCPCCPQTLCCSIALRDLHRLHLLSPLEADRPPGLELNYGSVDSPQTIWFELPQVSGQGL